ncbi:MAG: hypothetical protein AAB632_01600 [Patescibacteria group bacterium]
MSDKRYTTYITPLTRSRYMESFVASYLSAAAAVNQNLLEYNDIELRNDPITVSKIHFLANFLLKNQW